MKFRVIQFRVLLGRYGWKCFKPLLFFYFICGSIFVQAQTPKTISGIIYSAKDRNPISGAYISIKVQSLGTLSNNEGKFQLIGIDNISYADSVQISYLGYLSKVVVVKDFPTNEVLKIYLAECTFQLKEIKVKPLTTKELIDKIEKVNQNRFITPVAMQSYYREFVYTNSKCTEYSDALCHFEIDAKQNPELYVLSSRCLKRKQEDPKKTGEYEAQLASNINPNKVFGYAFFSDLLDKYFPKETLDGYEYQIQDNIQGNLLIGETIFIFSKISTKDLTYSLTLITDTNYILKNYSLEIPPSAKNFAKQRNLLGLHFKLTDLIIKASFSLNQDGLYPTSISMQKAQNFWGKFLGVSINEHILDITNVIFTNAKVLNSSNSLAGKNSRYKKGNMCSSSQASINDSLLKNNTILLPTQMESRQIDSLNHNP